MRFLLLLFVGMVKAIMFLFVILVLIAAALAYGFKGFLIFLGIYFLITCMFNKSCKSIKRKLERY